MLHDQICVLLVFFKVISFKEKRLEVGKRGELRSYCYRLEIMVARPLAELVKIEVDGIKRFRNLP